VGPTAILPSLPLWFPKRFALRGPPLKKTMFAVTLLTSRTRNDSEEWVANSTELAVKPTKCLITPLLPRHGV
jgi:hypothetical protein